jgi:subtilase family serine protease
LSYLLVVLIVLTSLAVPVHAASAPDLTVENVWLEDASQIGQPISQVSPGQSFNIIATIKNIGQETASGYYLDVYYDYLLRG